VATEGQKGFAPLIIVIILAIVGIVAAYYFGSMKGNVLLAPTQTPTSVTTNAPSQITPTTKPTSDPTTNWQSYTNSKYSFSFKYPLDYKVTASPVTGNQYNVIVDQKTNTSEAGLVPIQLSINMATNENGNSLVITTIKEAEAHYIKSFSSNSVTRKDITVANHPAISITGVLAGPGPGEGSFLHHTFVQLNKEVLIIQLGNKSYQSVFDQILSTFKFTK